MSNKGIRAFKELDAHELNLLPVFGTNELHRRERFVDCVRAGCPAYTITFPESDSPLAVVGGRFVYQKVFRVWSLVDVEVEDFPIYYVKRLRKLIDLCFVEWQLARIEVVMRADQAWCDRWSEVLGFEKEALMKKYGDEAVDYFLFARTV